MVNAKHALRTVQHARIRNQHARHALMVIICWEVYAIHLAQTVMLVLMANANLVLITVQRAKIHNQLARLA